MAFDWREFLLIAHEQRRDPREGIQRTSLGRAYYYVYHVGFAKAGAETFRIVQGRGGSHQQLWNWFQSHQDGRMRRLGVEGNRMHSLRISADYKREPISNIAQEVQRQIERAQAFEALMAEIEGRRPPAFLAQ